MADLSLVNALKTAFSALGAKTSDSNYAIGLFDKTTAEPKGIMGMSDLASVLGVASVLQRNPSNKNCNYLEGVGTFYIIANGEPGNVWTNGPVSNFIGHFLQFNLSESGNIKAQYAYILDISNNTYYFASRNYRIEDTGWSVWKKVALT